MLIVDNEPVLVQYVRNDEGNKVGVVVATGVNQVGWSSCNTKLGDIFNREFGLKVAIERAKKNSQVRVPDNLQHMVKRMKERGNRFFYKRFYDKLHQNISPPNSENVVAHMDGHNA